MKNKDLMSEIPQKAISHMKVTLLDSIAKGYVELIKLSKFVLLIFALTLLEKLFLIKYFTNEEIRISFCVITVLTNIDRANKRTSKPFLLFIFRKGYA